MSAASAPFPIQTHGPLRSVALIPERNEFVPSWYVPHAKPESTIVVHEGKPIAGGFTIAEMLPERRWAVRESGEVLSQLEFQELYQRKLLEWFRHASIEGQQGRGKVPSSFAVHREPVPAVAAYVAMRLDPRDPRKTLPIGYDPEATKGTRPDRLWDSENERFLEGNERMAVLVDAYRKEQAGGRKTLRSYEREEVERHLAGNGGAAPSPILAATQAKIAVLTELRENGTLSDAEYAGQIAKMFGAGAEKANTCEEHRKPGYAVMACGAQVTNLHRKRHVAKCTVCQEQKKS